MFTEMFRTKCTTASAVYFHLTLHFRHTPQYGSQPQLTRAQRWVTVQLQALLTQSEILKQPFLSIYAE